MTGALIYRRMLENLLLGALSFFHVCFNMDGGKTYVNPVKFLLQFLTVKVQNYKGQISGVWFGIYKKNPEEQAVDPGGRRQGPEAAPDGVRR